MYRRNENLRSAKDTVELCDSQVKELEKCAADPEYFLRNYWYISTKDFGYQHFPMRPKQAELLSVLANEKMIKGDWYRQSGFTTLVLGYMVWKILFSHNFACLYMTPKKALAYGYMNDIVREKYQLLPFWMQRGVKIWTKSLIILDNGSRLAARAASADNARGMRWDFIFIDEFGWIKDKAMLAIVALLLPTVEASTRTRLVLGQSHRFGRQTTANLMFWQNTSMQFHVSELSWDQDTQHDEKWAARQRLCIGEKQFAREYCGVIESDVPGKQYTERFGKWTVCRDGNRSPVGEHSKGRYICAIVAFGRKSGVPVSKPYTQVLVVNHKGEFVGLKSDSYMEERVMAWMPEPDIPSSIKKLCNG